MKQSVADAIAGARRISIAAMRELDRMEGEAAAEWLEAWFDIRWRNIELHIQKNRILLRGDGAMAVWSISNYVQPIFKLIEWVDKPDWEYSQLPACWPEPSEYSEL